MDKLKQLESFVSVATRGTGQQKEAALLALHQCERNTLVFSTLSNPLTMAPP